MDIYCPICGEPVGIDHLHDVVEEIAPDADSAKHEQLFVALYRNFRAKGCIALGAAPHCRANGSPVAAIASAFMDLLGDDIDGTACEIEDALGGAW